MKLYQKLGLVGSAGLLAMNAGATAVDYTPLSGAVDVSTVVTAIVAMGALLVAPRVARWATKLIARFF